jgi:hypothetical protein
MTRNELIRYDFAKLFAKKGYAYFTNGAYNLNIIGVRSSQGSKVTNRFDDWFVVTYKDKAGAWKRHVWPCTTEPGLDMMKNPSNRKGTAILVPGQYRGMWRIDMHNGKYKALCQRTKPCKVYRDGNKDDVYDLLPTKVDTGIFGINMHRASKWGKVNVVGKYSAGCQVFQDVKDFNAMMELAQKQLDAGLGNSFTYTILDEKEL